MKRTLVIHPDDRSTDMLGYEAESDGQVAELLMPLMHAMRDTIDMDNPITQYNRYRRGFATVVNFTAVEKEGL